MEAAEGMEEPSPAEALLEAERRPRSAPEPVADGVERRLDPRHVALERLILLVIAAATFAAGAASVVLVHLLAGTPTWLTTLLAALCLGLTAGLVWLGRFWPELDHRHTSYKVDALGIEIRRGVLWRKVITVPRLRVQHTDVSQGPLERRYGLGTLLIYTEGTEHAEVDLHGLEHGTALRVRDDLLTGRGGDGV